MHGSDISALMEYLHKRYITCHPILEETQQQRNRHAQVRTENTHFKSVSTVSSEYIMVEAGIAQSV
ncbi:hypothetical protein B7P43_G13987 [Cryptotermes secundus]|uniref:Uncharacterized protein n=1 Tax=Cryptotermes secundus TaxID=105785 RepID=A0A2J7PWQ4_9NEOP|nr:hypothetical protein B7P43_G13987 [Cryptotermes secundus]